jgi:hypothetical protein
MKPSKYVTIFLTALFIGIVLLERVPGVMVPTSEPYESLMFGLFEISLLDDITHGLSGLLGLMALIAGYRYVVYYLMLVGGYYALDATFFILNGIFTKQPLIENLSLNIPHIGITVLVIYALRKSLKKIELY